jgi:ankyrin repeat protein
MHLAAENGHATIIELLADKYKASIFERTKDGSTLMHIASLNGHAECAMMLFKKGVYLHMPNKVTSFFSACRNKYIVNTSYNLYLNTFPGRCKKYPYCCAVWPCWDHQHTSSKGGEG